MENSNTDIGNVITDRVTEATCPHCSAHFDVSHLEPFTKVECPECSEVQSVPARLAQFLLLDLIGMGGMGGVYYAKDQTLGRHVAIKVMLQSLGNDPEFVESFKHEAQAVAKLNHPNIAQIYSFGQEKGQPYIVMELVSGKRFDEMIEEGQPLNQALVMKVGLQIAEGLSAADEIGLIHGDIKPENILLDEKQKAKLVDFGLATFVNQRVSEGIWGTPYYIAPEKIRRQRIDARADIYSLGATLYHALSGRPPFEGDTPLDVVKARLDTSPPDLSEVRSDINPQVAAIVARMLLPHPAKRYPTYASLISDMRKAMASLAPSKGSSRKVVIKRRGGKSASADSGAISDLDPEDTDAPKSGKIVVRRGGKTMTVQPRNGGGEPETGTPEAEEDTGEPVAAPETGAGPAKAARGKSKLKTLLWVILILAVIGGGTGATLYLRAAKKKTIAIRREKYALLQARAKAKDTYAEVLLAVTNIVTTTEPAGEFIVRATNSVFIVLGEVFEAPPPPTPTPPPPPAPAAAPPPVAAPGTNSAAGTTNGQTQAEAGSTNAPADPADAAPADTPPPPEAEPVPTVSTPVEEEPLVDEPPIKQMARRIILASHKMTAERLAALDIRAEASELNDEAQQTTSSRKATARVATLAENLTALGVIKGAVREAYDTATRTLRQTDTIVARTEREREARRKEDEEDAKRRAEEEAERRKQEKRQALIQSELDRAQAEHENILPMIKQNKFKDAADAVKPLLRQYETEEGKAAVTVLIERCTMLNDLRLFLVKQLTEDPFKWGWIQDRSAEDVLAAGPLSIRLRGRMVPWQEVTPRQMLHFIKHYVSKEDLTIDEHSEQNLAAAIFCFEHGGLEAAAAFASSAVEMDTSERMREKVRRLLPLE